MQIPKQIPLKLSKLLEIFQKNEFYEDISEMYQLGENFDLYRESADEILEKDTIVYVDDSFTGDKNNEDVYPEFVVKNGLEFCCSGEIFIDVVLSVFGQTKTPSIDNFVNALNYYNKHDVFLDIKL